MRSAARFGFAVVKSRDRRWMPSSPSDSAMLCVGGMCSLRARDSATNHVHRFAENWTRTLPEDDLNILLPIMGYQVPDEDLGTMEHWSASSARGDGHMDVALVDATARSPTPPSQCTSFTPNEPKKNVLSNKTSNQHTLPVLGKIFKKNIKGVEDPKLKLRSHSTPATMQWLSENYEQADGVCIPRHVIYKHYCAFCRKNFMLPVNAASFGKIIRQQFRMVKNRRLGTRGCSTYHYYGIAIQLDSEYFEEQYGKSRRACTSGLRRPNTHQVSISHIPYQCKLGSVRPEFPSTQEFSLPISISEEQFGSFLTMYRAHCQRIYDSIFKLNLNDVKGFLSHFWTGVPLHLEGILGFNAVVNIVGVCDSILYRAISDAVMPNMQKSLPVGLLDMLEKLTTVLITWLQEILLPMPKVLAEMKLNLARHFCRMMRRVISMHKVWWSVSLMLQNVDIVAQMHTDWKDADLDLICREIFIPMSENAEHSSIILKLFNEFEMLLRRQAKLETFLEWLRNVAERCILPFTSHKKPCIRLAENNFLLMWSRVGSLVIREMTLSSAKSFGSFHLLGILTNDYITHCIEILDLDQRIHELKTNITVDISPVIDFGNMLQWKRCSIDTVKSHAIEIEKNNVTSATGPIQAVDGLQSDPKEIVLDIPSVPPMEYLCLNQVSDCQVVAVRYTHDDVPSTPTTSRSYYHSLGSEQNKIEGRNHFFQQTYDTIVHKDLECMEERLEQENNGYISSCNHHYGGSCRHDYAEFLNTQSNSLSDTDTSMVTGQSSGYNNYFYYSS